MTKNSQAVSLLRTWLDACSIPYDSTDSSIALYPNSDLPGVPATFDPHAIMSTDMTVAMGEFHKITKEAGYGEPTPVNRGEAPLKKRIFKDNLLARWRHSEMRTVPNATTEELKLYSPVSKREANIFYSRNRYMCSLMGYDLNVAQNDALIWTNTFLGRYKIRREDPEMEESENKKLLTNYLRQRFTEIANGLVREQRNVMPGGAYTAHIRDYGEEPSAEWKSEHDEIGFKSPPLRKAKVKEILNQNFARMGHEDMVETLTTTSKDHPCIDTRHAAAKYLRDHVASCNLCPKGQE
jgi:hypothetical protein